MKIVIDIPKWLYDSISEYPSRGFAVSQLERVILHGTVLPKHGRLIDADEYFKISWEHPDYDLGDDAPTILEATKESRNENYY